LGARVDNYRIVPDSMGAKWFMKMKKETRNDWDILFSYWENNQISMAYEYSKIFTAKHPNNIKGLIVKADILKSFARFSEAEKCLNNALKVSPSHLKANIFIQFGHLYKEKRDLANAKSYYKKAIKIKETNSRYNSLASCYSIEGNFKEAKLHFNKAIKISDCNPDESYYNLGLIARAEGLYIESKSWFGKATNEDSEYDIAKEALEDIKNVIEFLRVNRLKLIKNIEKSQ
jgi:tetratricopeptide (TPR) repeat protein